MIRAGVVAGMLAVLSANAGVMRSFEDLSSRRAEVKLSPDGSVSTPEAALDKVRKLRAEGRIPARKEAVIQVVPGRYRLECPLSLGPADANIRFVGTDPNACVFDGGTRLLPFTIGADGVWETDAPEGFSCDQLWVNGKRAIRARSPNAGHFFVRDVDPFNPNRDFFIDPHELAPLAGLSPDALHRVRAWVWQSWDTGAIALEAIDAASGRVTGRNRLKWPLCRFASTGCPRHVLENFRAALDAPGEWFHDWERGKILYLPRTGEAVGSTTAIVPRASGLINLVGSASVTFENIGFEHAGWEIGSRGVENLQSAWPTTNAAVLVVRSTNVVFRNVRIAHAGAHGVWFADGTRDASLIHSLVEDVGACGVRIGPSVTATRGVDGTVLASGIEVADSIVRAGGREQEGSAGILLTHVADCRVVHNDIYDFYYTGVSVGWTWGYAATLNRRNRIDSNRIHHVNQGHLSDMAAVYTLGDNEGTTVCGNWIHDVVGYPYSDADSCGFYTDEGSHGILFASNLVERCPGVAVNHHYGRDVTFANNIFSGFRTCGVSRVREEGHPTIRVVNNVFFLGRFLGPCLSDGKRACENRGLDGERQRILVYVRAEGEAVLRG